MVGGWGWGGGGGGGGEGEGVMLYFKEHIQAYEVQIEAEADFSKAIWCSLESQGSKIIVGVA